MAGKELKALEARVARLEDAVFVKKVKLRPGKEPESFSGATGGVRFLITKDFFKEKRKLGDVFNDLTKNGYHWSRQAVDMALKALSSRSGPLILLKEGGHNVFVRRK